MKPVLITGGAGFVGTNLAHRLLSQKTPVVIYDNLSRAGVEQNLNWLRQMHGPLVSAVIADVRDRTQLSLAVKNAQAVFHFAAQVAVTTSLENPADDFAINAGGTLNVLEALRSLEQRIPLVFTSTNKVYGSLEDVTMTEMGLRYQPEAKQIHLRGIGEDRPLDFHSPYGCSKGTADQYVLDYCRSYGLPTVVFRMSCIYGPHQFGTEDQGWVAHFLIRALEGRQITLYGDGKQVRDILFVEDLVDAFMLAKTHCLKLAGQAFNIGGGVNNTTSLLELLDAIEALHGRRPAVRFHDWRTGDQKYYVSNFHKFQQATGWAPRFEVAAGLRHLYDWLCSARAARPRAAPLEAVR